VSTWSEACDAHREFCRLFPLAILGPQPENQAEVFSRAQLKFSSTLEASRPFMHDAVWSAFEKFDVEMCVWKNQELPMPIRKETRAVVRHALDQCHREIRTALSGQLSCANRAPFHRRQRRPPRSLDELSTYQKGKWGRV